MKRCLICFEDLYHHVPLLSYFCYKDIICGACRSKMILHQKWNKLNELDVYSFYIYDRYMESLLFQYKEGRDIALSKVFFHPFINFIEKQFKGYTIIYMPSSEQHLKRRGFFPLEEMLEEVNLKKCHYFVKTREYKQSSQSYENRKQVKDVIAIKDKSDPLPNKILLVDDVCTSGETLLCAYELIKSETRSIKALILCDNRRSVELCDEKKFPIFNILDILKRKSRSWIQRKQGEN